MHGSCQPKRRQSPQPDSPDLEGGLIDPVLPKPNSNSSFIAASSAQHEPGCIFPLRCRRRRSLPLYFLFAGILLLVAATVVGKFLTCNLEAKGRPTSLAVLPSHGGSRATFYPRPTTHANSIHCIRNDRLGKINSPKSLTNAWWWILTFVGVVVAAFMVLILLGRKKEKGWGHAFQLCKFWEYDWREICKCSRRWVIGGVGKG